SISRPYTTLFRSKSLQKRAYNLCCECAICAHHSVLFLPSIISGGTSSSLPRFLHLFESLPFISLITIPARVTSARVGLSIPAAIRASVALTYTQALLSASQS